MTIKTIKLKRAVSLLPFMASLLVSACATPPQRAVLEATSSARLTATPDAAPQRTITNFTESLRCMDGKLATYGISNLLLGTQEVKDPTSEVAGTKDMLLTALSTMSRKSKAFSVVTMSADLNDITAFHTYHASKKFESPDFFIRLSAAQIDKGVQFDQIGGGVRFKGAFGVEHSRDRIASIVSLDLNLGTVRNLQLLPGIYSSNSIAVIRRGTATDISGEIRKMGALFRIANDNSEGFHHSVRTLIELGAIELVGRLTQIPYWECLDISATNPGVQAQLKDWYDALNANELRKFIQSKLIAIGYLKGDVDGHDSEEFRKAISLYKKREGLVANNAMDFMLYYQLMMDPTPVAIQHIQLLTRSKTDEEINLEISQGDESGKLVKVAQHVAVLDNPHTADLDFTFSTDHGDKPVVYKAGETINLTLTPTMDAHIFCYYQQGDGQVFKLFPNRYRPSSLISAQTTLSIPGTEKFSIQADRAGYAEGVMCLASYTDIEKKLPFPLREKDLQPLPISSLAQVYDFYKKVGEVVPLQKTIQIEVQ